MHWSIFTALVVVSATGIHFFSKLAKDTVDPMIALVITTGAAFAVSLCFLPAAQDGLVKSLTFSKGPVLYTLVGLCIALAHLGVAQVQLAMGDPAGALAALQEAEQLATYRTLVPPEATFLTTHRVRIWLRQGDFAAATRWIQLSGLQVDHEPAYRNEQELIALARILVWRSQTNKQALDLQQAAVLLTRLAEWLRTTERAGHLLSEQLRFGRLLRLHRAVRGRHLPPRLPRPLLPRLHPADRREP